MNAGGRQIAKNSSESRSSSIGSEVVKCRGFQALKSWQVERYRQAVKENRWFISQREYRRVNWTEAEQDFLNQDYYGCAEKWRQEYCGEICPFKENCLLAFQMLKANKPVSLPKAG